ncbi:hypothetical protein ACOSP7_013149 [Xanthoceras sorbifolium]
MIIYSPGAPQASCALAHTGSSPNSFSRICSSRSATIAVIFRSLPLMSAPTLPIDTYWSLTRAFCCCYPASFHRPISPIASDSFLTASIAALVDQRASLIWSSCCQLSITSASIGLGRYLH